ncbi:MAG TPA: type II secretion system protein [Candidatus Humimicrobiaceae bacterium]|nr:type II secretion system protein [Candidatus Humimicrobiaceae bacterium]
MTKNKKGFTLIELLIVIAIITILAAGAVVGINPAQRFKSARNATRWNHMNSIATAVYSYAVENNGAFPGCIPIVGAAAVNIDTCATDLADYVSIIPTPPLDGDGEDYMIEQLDVGIKITSTAAEANEAGNEVVLIQ